MESGGHDDAAAADATMISNSSPYQPTTEPVPHRRTICLGLILDTFYIKSIQGILKVIEIVFCIIVLICLGASPSCDPCSGFGFLQAVGITCLILTLVLYVIFALTLNTKITMVNWTFTDLINAGIDCLLFIIASIVLATQNPTPAAKAAVAFGFFSAVAYGVSTWMAYRAFVVDRHKRKSHVPHTAGQPESADV